MKALQLTSDPQDKKSIDAKCRELLTTAEKIKKSKDAFREGGKSVRVPVSSRRLTTREEIILLEGSKLNGFTFPPWVHPPDSSEFEPKNEGELFTYVKDLVT